MLLVVRGRFWNRWTAVGLVLLFALLGLGVAWAGGTNTRACPSCVAGATRCDCFTVIH